MFQCWLTEEKLIDLDEPVAVSPLAAPPTTSGNSSRKSASPKPKPSVPENLSRTGKEMWELLKNKKGLVVIGKSQSGARLGPSYARI